MLEVACVRPNAKLSGVLLPKHNTSINEDVSTREASVTVFVPCPLVSAPSPLRRTAASWYPPQSGRRRSATSLSDLDEETRWTHSNHFRDMHAEAEACLTLTLLSRRYFMMALMKKEKTELWEDCWCFKSGLIHVAAHLCVVKVTVGGEEDLGHFFNPGQEHRELRLWTTKFHHFCDK